MCFNLDIKSIPRIATKNIKVQKLFIHIKDKFISPYMEFEYERGVVYKSKLRFNYTPYGLYIDKGLHSYTNETKITVVNHVDSCYCSLSLNDMNYSLFAFDKNNDVCIRECIIPKGSIYFMNKEGEIVSNKLKLL